MDVIQLAQAGFAEAVAALGTAITSHHVSTLFRLTDHVIFAFDGDAAGRKAARRALEATLPVIVDTKRASFVLLPEGEDPDSLIQTHGAGAFEDEVERALPLSRWFVESLSEGRNLANAEDRSALLASARPLLAAMPTGAFRLQLTQELAQAAKTPATDVESLFGLQPWRRLPAKHPAPARGAAPIGDLKSRILRHLWVFPELAREFNAQIAAEFLERGEPIDRQIVEVWRAATSGESSSSGALLELLADSEHAEAYRALANGDGLLDQDAAAAREDLGGAFYKLRLRTLEALKKDLARADPTPDNLRLYQEADREYAALRADGERSQPPADTGK
jgi:DNA primase